ncbi:uncharacterized protein C3orf38 homolog [Corythoichthys intestinalis]|uniref:uncharacterized protein C3orf38 homolog n=1 Tax=Corythoichthys intestinalis TaxID=161448 RepID=UPI0025A65D6B|nr:uncharacterized protein C3orf38 homolog [Corythoichthys intestinalis]XP_061799232.1 uncharacterized protein C3orf38 homolog [Nerophis lumbriciformis]
MSLSELERSGCLKILTLMSKVDLLSLVDTVTNKMIAVENVTEARETILSFSKNAEELLKRKKVHRDLIFKYLAKEGVAMPPSSEKHQLVKRTLALWSTEKGAVKEHIPQATDDMEERPVPKMAEETADTEADYDRETLVLGQQFCSWFFQLLNSQNPSLGQQPQDWGPQHFWTDTKLNLVASAGNEQMEEFAGAELVSCRLLALTKDERLHFSPNLEANGLKALASPHGLVLVAVAGTIHRDTACLGIFEQIFGLIRSPMDNNSWKIKFVNMKIRGQDAIVGTQTPVPALMYNSSDLLMLSTQ